MLRSCGVLLVAASAVGADPSFAPIQVPHHEYTGGWEHFVGGGLAVFDCSGDGLPDLFAAGGEAPSTLLRNTSAAGSSVSFAETTLDTLRLTGVTGAYPLDIDSDGILDLAILRVGPNMLLQGKGDCAFEPFEGLNFTSGDRWTTAFSATWEAGNTLPTLAFGNYVDRSHPDGPFRTCDTNFLYRPQDGSYGEPIALEPGFCPLSMLFSDWSGSGRADLRLSNDRHYYVSGGYEQLWEMGTEPREFSEEDGWQRHMLWGMGIASRDIDHDGLQEVYLTSMGDQRLQKRAPNHDGPRFEDVPYAMGTTAHRPYLGGDGRPSTGWHVAFGDVQNDGRDDIFITKGNVEQMPDTAMKDPNNLLLQQADGRFAEVGGQAGLASLHRGRGGALVDLNGDGLLDVVVVNRRAPLEVWQNTTAEAGSWIAIDARQPGSNSRAVGGWIEVDNGNGTRMTRELTVGGGHAGGVSVPEHFGLGATSQFRVRVIWPDGQPADWQTTPVNRLVTIERGTGG